MSVLSLRIVDEVAHAVDGREVPLMFELLKRLALRVVADDLARDEAAYVELFGAEL